MTKAPTPTNPSHKLALMASIAFLLQVYCLYSLHTGTLRLTSASVYALYFGIGVTFILFVASVQTLRKRRGE